MNKIARSFLLTFPRAYDLLSYIKNNYFLNFYFKKVHEHDFEAFSLLSDQKPQLFLDIGANAGMSALSIFVLKSNAKVISFEPNPINYPYLAKIAAKFTNFQYHKVGLGNHEGKIDFYYPVYNGKTLTALGSFNYKNAATWLNNRTVYFFDKNKLKIERIVVEVKQLDNFNLEPDFIKIDVEGFEYYVLIGAEKTINRCRPILLIEGVAHQDKSDRFLQERDYLAYKFFNNQFYADDFNCDNNFYIPREKLHLIESYQETCSTKVVAGVT